MSENFGALQNRIRHHYQNKSIMNQFMTISRRNIHDFESIPHVASINDNDFPQDDFGIDSLAEVIGQGITNTELSNFVRKLNEINDNVIETTLEKLVDTLDDTVSNLWDAGYELNQLYLPFNLKNEIRERKQLTQPTIPISVINFSPTIVRELGHNQIILARNTCFEKIYPEIIEEQVRIFPQRRIGNYTIECNVRQKLVVRNKEVITKVIVTDIEA